METLNQLLAFHVEEIPFVLLVLLISFTIHEFAHAYSAYKFGDPTPKKMGRVTLNPRVHLDVFGTILIFIAGFGWAKPVLVNRANLRSPRWMGIVVSAVGPISNLILAFFGLFAIYALLYFGLMDGFSVGVKLAISLFLEILVQLNIILFIFNLIPLPPLDGYRILEDLLPVRWAVQLQKLQHWSMLIFLLMVFIRPVSDVTIRPLFRLGNDILNFFHAILGTIFHTGL